MRFVLPEQKKWVHAMEIPVRWGDMDAMGHLNNTVYLRYFETLRVQWLDTLGAHVRPEAGQGVVIVNAFVNFLRQVSYPGTLRGDLYVAQPGRSSFETYMTLVRTDAPHIVCAEGGARTVWTDYAAQQSRPLPDWLRARLT